jgi:hypothetical protein
MKIKQKYTLYFDWENIRYEDSVAAFDRAFFHGPVMENANRIEPNTYIDLDFTPQNLSSCGLFIPENFYIARLSWGDVKYHEDNVVELFNCTLSHNKGGTLRNLQDGQYFILNCERHEETIHHKFLTYEVWVMNNEDNVI